MPGCYNVCVFVCVSRKRWGKSEQHRQNSTFKRNLNRYFEKPFEINNKHLFSKTTNYAMIFIVSSEIRIGTIILYISCKAMDLKRKFDHIRVVFKLV